MQVVMSGENATEKLADGEISLKVEKPQEEGDGSARPKTRVRNKHVTSMDSIPGVHRPLAEESEAEEVKEFYTKEDVEKIFTNLFCYSNLLQSMSEDNDSDHFRFIKFMQQVEHKQSELIRVSETLPDSANLAIDLAYNLVVTSSYMSLMFNFNTGKKVAIEEMSDMALNTAHHMLEFAHLNRSELVPDCCEALITVMQKFCLNTVVTQINDLPNLSSYQQKVLAKILDIVNNLECSSSSEISLSSLDINDDSSDDSALAEAVKQAQDFGRNAYQHAVGNTAADGSDKPNINNNAGDSPNNSESSKKTRGSSNSTNGEQTQSAGMDDIILFTKCNPFYDIWRLYVDNANLVSLFKIDRKLKDACVETLPNCFKIMLWVEEITHNIVSHVVEEESEMVNNAFHILQELIGQEGDDEQSSSLLDDIAESFTNMADRYDALVSLCEVNVSNAIKHMKSNSPLTSDSETE